MPLTVDVTKIEVDTVMEFFERVMDEINERSGFSEEFNGKLFQVIYAALYDAIEEDIGESDGDLREFLGELKEAIKIEITEPLDEIDLTLGDLHETDDVSEFDFVRRFEIVITRVLQTMGIPRSAITHDQKRMIGDITLHEMGERINLI